MSSRLDTRRVARYIAYILYPFLSNLCVGWDFSSTCVSYPRGCMGLTASG
jgi:hypothetical protein